MNKVRHFKVETIFLNRGQMLELSKNVFKSCSCLNNQSSATISPIFISLSYPVDNGKKDGIVDYSNTQSFLFHLLD